MVIKNNEDFKILDIKRNYVDNFLKHTNNYYLTTQNQCYLPVDAPTVTGWMVACAARLILPSSYGLFLAPLDNYGVRSRFAWDAENR